MDSFMKKKDDQNKKLVVKVCISEWSNASRDKRELSVCRELGADVKVVAKGNPQDKGRLDNVAGFDVYRLSARPIRVFPVVCNRIVSIFTWAKYVYGMNADIISGHDITGLTIAWLSNFFKTKSQKAKLIYDSHEFEIGRNVQRNIFQIWVITAWERFLIGKSEFMIVVNDSIADEVVKLHKLKKRPVVVRNIPPHWNVDEEECRIVREQFLADFDRAGGGTSHVPRSNL